MVDSTQQASLDLALIGNCQYSALLDRRGSVVWACFPRFDSPSVFGALLDPERGGHFTIEGVGEGWRTDAAYEPNTCIVKTVWSKPDEPDAFEVVDFAPRFQLYDRFFRPTVLARIVRRLGGRPRVRIVCDPRFDYGRREPVLRRGSNHITYEDPGTPDKLRLTTSASLTHVIQAIPFELTRELHLALAWGEPFEDTFEELERWRRRTDDYWRRWCTRTRVPVDYQDAVLRASMTLKLHTFEDTGAVIAATTTSIPEADGTGRTWDYRYCWVRDAAFVIRSQLRMGHSEDASRFCEYLRNLVPLNGRETFELQPVYGIDHRDELTETTLDHLAGYRDNQPVRVGNQAYTHCQNDVYGEVVLGLAPMFYDERLRGSELEPIYEAFEHLVSAAERKFRTVDAGIWEYRGREDHHVFSKFMCWVALDRASRIAERLGHTSGGVSWRGRADAMRKEILEKGYSTTAQAFVSSYGSTDLDASLLLMPILRFLPVDDARIVSTVDAMQRRLVVNGYMFRYRHEDDFGDQRSAFTICSTWMIEALWLAGRRDEARQMFEKLLAARNSFGLLSEDIDPSTGELWGNFPQTYSMLGLINCAVRLSPTWDEIF